MGFEKQRLERLIRLQHTDPGFFLLGTHSYIESWLRQKLHLWDEGFSFGDLLFRYKISLIENAKSFPRQLSVLQTLRTKDKTAVAVRQNFIEISKEEAAASAYRLLQFCSLAGIDQPEELGQIREVLDIWEDRGIIPDDELSSLRRKITESRRRNENLLTEIDDLRRCRSEADFFAARIAELEAEIIRLKKQNIGGQADELVRRMAEASEAAKKREESGSRLDSLQQAEEYVSGLGRLTSYTRTRFDFESDITRLTPEQQEVLDSISLTGDFLVKGGAGTGKTLVLIKALEKALHSSRDELSFDDSVLSVRMLTFNRTLAKYDRYLAEILQQNEGAANISTVDKYLYDQLKLIDENHRIIFDDNYAEELASDFNDTDFFDNSRLAAEIDGFIFAGALSKEQYLKCARGLSRKQLEHIWEISLKAAGKMRETSAFTKNYSRSVILQYPGDILRNTDFAFIDEVQDLTEADIRAVKACTKRAVVMAGDIDQSIYRAGFTFSRAGVNIRGTTRILKTNFRNSIEIQNAAEKYRLLTPDADSGRRVDAFRTGPPPELYSGANPEELTAMIIKRIKLFTGELDYDPENICILVPSGRDIEPLKSSLKGAGFDSDDLRTDEFSFKTQGIIRISTMHSSKGLDFPVVLLFLHKLPQTSSAFDRTGREKLRRNLIYVSMTRAMDHLNIFTLRDETAPEIADLSDILA